MAESCWCADPVQGSRTLRRDSKKFVRWNGTSYLTNPLATRYTLIMSEPFSDQLRRAVRECGRSRYAISCETGTDQSTLSRFMKGGGLSLNVVDKLMDALNLEIRPRRKARKAK